MQWETNSTGTTVRYCGVHRMPWGTDSLINSKFKKTNQAHNLRAPPPEQEELSCPLCQHQILLLQAKTSFSPPTLKMLSYVLFCDTYLHCTCSLIYEAFITLVVEKIQNVSNACIFTLTLGWVPQVCGTHPHVSMRMHTSETPYTISLWFAL